MGKVPKKLRCFFEGTPLPTRRVAALDSEAITSIRPSYINSADTGAMENFAVAMIVYNCSHDRIFYTEQQDRVFENISPKS